MPTKHRYPPASEAGSNQSETTNVYPNPASIQNAALITRLRARRITPRVMVVYAAVLTLLTLADPWCPTFALGCVVVGSGLALRVWSFGHLRKNQALITTGPYAYTRNPAYLGSAIVMIGLFIAAGNPYTKPGIGLWLAGLIGLYIFFAHYLPRKYRREYGKLRSLFGPSLDRHAAHVPDFLPRLTPWHSGDPQRFSWTCVRANHEWIWPVACAFGLWVMWLG